MASSNDINQINIPLLNDDVLAALAQAGYSQRDHLPPPNDPEWTQAPFDAFPSPQRNLLKRFAQAPSGHCSNCGESGHYPAYCPHARGHCSNCGESGHYPAYCPHARGEYVVGTKRKRLGDAGPPQKKARSLEQRLEELEVSTKEELRELEVSTKEELRELEVSTKEELRAQNLRISNLQQSFGVLSGQSSQTHTQRWTEMDRAGLVTGPVPLAEWWGIEIEQARGVASLPGFDGAVGCKEAVVQEWADSEFQSFAAQGTRILSSCQSSVGKGGKGKQVPDTLKIVGVEMTRPTAINTVAAVEHKRPLGPEEEKVSKAKLPRELVKCFVGLNQCAERIKWMLKHQPGRVFADAALLDGRAVLFVRGTLLDGRPDSFKVKFCFSEAAQLASSGTGLAMLQRFLQRPVAAHGFVGVLRVASLGKTYQARSEPLGAGRTSIVCRLDPASDVADAVPVELSDSGGTGPFVGKVYRFVDVSGARPDKGAADTEVKMLELLHDVESTPQFVGRCETPCGVHVVFAKPPGRPLQSMSLDSFGTAVTVLRRAHELGIVHRDVKAANMFECNQRFYLNDWGSALQLDDGDTAVPNHQRLGTDGHRSPFVLRSGANRPMDDFYALAVSLALATKSQYDKPWPYTYDKDADAAEEWIRSLPDEWQAVFAIVQAEGFDVEAFVAAVHCAL